MDEPDGGEILIVTSMEALESAGPVERGWGADIAGAAVKAVPVSVLRANMEQFLDHLREFLGSGTRSVGDFEIAEVEIKAQISGDGKISLLGTGVKMGVSGGLTFVLRRRPD